jgi:hypothetical protein
LIFASGFLTPGISPLIPASTSGFLTLRSTFGAVTSTFFFGISILGGFTLIFASGFLTPGI